MPKSHSGIRRVGSSRVIDKSKYEPPTEYRATTPYSEEYVKDPEGTLVHRKTKERYSRKETYAENPGFQEMRKAPVGSVIVVHQPRLQYVREVVPAHDEYYEVFQRTRSTKTLRSVFTQDKEGRYITSHGVTRSKAFYPADLTSAKEIQAEFKHTTRITIYKPKKG